MPSKLKAFYYPYSRCTNESTLKQAILIFDELWFIDPASDKMRQGLMSPRRHLDKRIIDDWKYLQDKYNKLIEKEFVHIFNPVDYILKFDKTLTAAFVGDIKDERFWKLFSKSNIPPVWHILKERVPPSTLDAFRGSWNPGYVEMILGKARNFDENSTGLVWHEKIPLAFDPKQSEKIKHFQEIYLHDDKQREFVNFVSKNMIYFDPEMGYSMDNTKTTSKKILDYAFSCAFSYVHGSSIIINQALLFSEILNAVPFTDSEVHHQILTLKHQTAVENSESIGQYFPKIKIAPNQQDILKNSILSLSIIDAWIPAEELAQLSLDDCLKYKERAKEHLERFREYLWELTSTIESNIWDVALETEIKKIILTKILPETRKQKDKLTDLRRKLFANLVVVTSSVAIPSLTASFFPFTNNLLMLLFGSSAIAGGSLALAAQEIKDSVLEYQNLKHNSMGYLLKLPNK